MCSSDLFLNPFNLGLITQQVMVVGTLAIGQTIIILTAGIDLSVGALAVFVSIVMGKLSADFGVPGGAALVIGFGFGTFLGLINGLLITRLRLPPFIVTLGTLSIFFSLNLFVSASTTIRGRDMDPLLTWTNTSITLPVIDVSIPISVFGMLIMYAIVAYILRYTAWGRHVYAVGDNPESARLTGVRSGRVLLLVYAGAGFIYAIGAWFLGVSLTGFFLRRLNLAMRAAFFVAAFADFVPHTSLDGGGQYINLAAALTGLLLMAFERYAKP